MINFLLIVFGTGFVVALLRSLAGIPPPPFTAPVVAIAVIDTSGVLLAWEVVRPIVWGVVR